MTCNKNKTYNPYVIACKISEVYGISKYTRDVLIELISLSERFKRVFPSVRELAYRASCSIRTVQYAVKRLKRLGLLSIQERFKRLGNRKVHDTNEYKLSEEVACKKGKYTIKELDGQHLDKICNECKDADFTYNDVKNWQLWWDENNITASYTLDKWQQLFAGWMKNKKQHHKVKAETWEDFKRRHTDQSWRKVIDARQDGHTVEATSKEINLLASDLDDEFTKRHTDSSWRVGL